MRRDHVRDLLRRVADGSLDAEQALDQLAFEPVESLGFASIDHHRTLRQGFPEVVFGEGKTPEQVLAIALHIAAQGHGLLVTRLAPEAAARLGESLPEVELNPVARTAYLAPSEPVGQGGGTILIVSAGTSDPPA